MRRVGAGRGKVGRGRQGLVWFGKERSGKVWRGELRFVVARLGR